MEDDFALDVTLVDLLVGFVFAGDTKTAAVFSFVVLFLFFVVGGVVVVSAGGLVDAVAPLEGFYFLPTSFLFFRGLATRSLELSATNRGGF